MTDEEVKELIFNVGANLKEDDFAFSVHYDNYPYDVYRFTLDGKEGTLAFRKVADKYEISVFAVGKLTEEQVIEKIRARINSRTATQS